MNRGSWRICEAPEHLQHLMASKRPSNPLHDFVQPPTQGRVLLAARLAHLHSRARRTCQKLARSGLAWRIIPTVCICFQILLPRSQTCTLLERWSDPPSGPAAVPPNTISCKPASGMASVSSDQQTAMHSEPDHSAWTAQTPCHGKESANHSCGMHQGSQSPSDDRKQLSVAGGSAPLAARMATSAMRNCRPPRRHSSSCRSAGPASSSSRPQLYRLAPPLASGSTRSCRQR